jgi:hypothetical protein
VEKIKLVYITGYGKSGGTLIGRLLGDTKNAFFVGELRYFWRYGILKNYDCTCGQKFDNCSFWKAVKDEYFQSFPSINIEEISEELRKFEKLKNYFKLKRYLKNKNNKVFKEKLNKYLQHNEKLYETISKLSGKKILVDYSNIPGRLLALSFSDKFEIYPIHLVRDPRGVLNSYIQADLRYYGKNKHSNLRQVLVWNINTIFSRIIIKKLESGKIPSILYKNFVKSPTGILNKLEGLFDDKFNYEEKNGKASVCLEPGHVFSGNRSRFESSNITLVEDTKWKKQLSLPNKILANIVSLPIYQYILKWSSNKQNEIGSFS